MTSIYCLEVQRFFDNAQKSGLESTLDNNTKDLFAKFEEEVLKIAKYLDLPLYRISTNSKELTIEKYENRKICKLSLRTFDLTGKTLISNIEELYIENEKYKFATYEHDGRMD